jgi:hypothetical protein
MKKVMKKAQGGIKLKPGQVTAKRAYAISDSLKKESEKPLDMTSKKSLETSLRNKQMNRQKSQRINQRADNAMEKAGSIFDRRTKQDDRMLKYKSGGSVKKKMEMGGSAESNVFTIPSRNKISIPKKAKSGGAFGMLSVKAGIDKNPNPTAADRIAGAKKLAKKGASVKKCKYGCK